VLFAAGETNVATDHLLDFLKVFAPAPVERSPISVRTPVFAAAQGAGDSDLAAGTTFRMISDSEPAVLVVFKTMTDPFAGRISFFKVVSGVVKTDATLENYTRRGQERFAHLSVMQGRKAVEVAELHAGDIGAVGKLRETFTGDTLGAKGAEIQVDLFPLPEPAMTYAIEPKSRADEDKLAPAIHKLMEEDLLIRFFRDPMTNEFLIAGAGQQHIETIVSRLKKRYHAEVTLKSPKVPYRETIRAKAEAQGRHKKQSGGHGQFGDCKIRMEPLPRGGGFEYANEVFGGAIPRNFIPAIEKGIVETAVRGFLAGYPVVDFKVTVFDGSYHDVDSNEMAFKIAGSMAFKEAARKATPVLLEPVMSVEVVVPEEYMGTIIGDLNSRRGRIEGMEHRAGSQVIKANVPLSEMFGYATHMRSSTQGRANYSMHFNRYEEAPRSVSEEIIGRNQGK
jgi:elongation factor G